MRSINTLALVIPTNEPEVAFQLLLANLHNLSSASDYITLLFNFQRPWTNAQISAALALCEEANLNTEFTINEYEIKGKGLVPFNQIRFDACNLLPNAKYFMLVDDDFDFLGRTGSINKDAGEQLLDCIHYMDTFNDCGIILLKNRTYLKHVDKYVIAPAPSLSNTYLTANGIILRNLNPAEGLILPNEAVSLLGSDEEKIACAWRMSKGYYPAIMNRARISHYENTVNTRSEIGVVDKPLTGEYMYDWNSKDILDNNANKFIRENFLPEFVNLGWKSQEIVHSTTYYASGGLDLSDSEEVALRTVNYGGIQL